MEQIEHLTKVSIFEDLVEAVIKGTFKPLDDKSTIRFFISICGEEATYSSDYRDDEIVQDILCETHPEWYQ